MTARASVFQRVLGWFVGMSERPVCAAPVTQPEPMHKLKSLMVGVASRDGRRGGGFQLMVDTLNVDHLTCKSRELLVEGDRYEVAMLLQGVGHLKLAVEVEWVLLSSYGHSAGLRVDHSDETRQALAAYVELVKQGARG